MPPWLPPAARSNAAVREHAAALLRLLYPPACAFCGRGVEAGRFCGPCRIELTQGWDEEACARCGAAVGPHLGGRADCDRCRGQTLAFQRVYRLGRYQGALASACLRLKDYHGFALAVGLVELFLERHGSELASFGPVRVAPVPLHWRRRIGRGYDQADHLARQLARRIAGARFARLLVRTRPTAVQHWLAPTARRENVRNAFRARRRPRIDGETVLLVDDIVTTGATCHQAARALRAAGAGKVHVCAIAKGGAPKGWRALGPVQ